MAQRSCLNGRKGKREQEEIRLILNPALQHSLISLLSVQLLENSNGDDGCQLRSLSWPS